MDPGAAKGSGSRQVLAVFVAGREDIGEVVFAWPFKDGLTVPLTQDTKTACSEGQ